MPSTLGFELDMRSGLGNCGGDRDVYTSKLIDYADSDDIQRLENLFTREDWLGYADTIHCISDVSMSIGAAKISDDAKALEYAARDGWVEFIREHHRAFVARHEKTCAAIRKGSATLATVVAAL